MPKSMLRQLLAILLLCHMYECLMLATFNIQVFGQKKMQNTKVRRFLCKILSRYDLVFIQEIRDSKGTAFPELVQELKRTTGRNYDFIVSQRLGNSSSKEQYGIIYDPKQVRVEKTFQFPDPSQKFERPPYAVLLKMPHTKVKEAAFIITHVDPDEVIREMEALANVAYLVENMWRKPLIILGDMNADCVYLSKKARKNLALKLQERYTWLVKDGTDTTVGKADCAYDRIIAWGWKESWFNLPSVRPFKFDKEWKLSQDEAKLVSDHYPVELQLV